MLEVQSQDFIRTAAAKGLHPVAVQLHHALRNALIPVTTWRAYGSLNPRQTIGRLFTTPLKVHRMGRRTEWDVGSSGGRSARHRFSRWSVSGCPGPLSHEFSGGQRQRIGIARALILQPGLVICDEPVSMLDLSVQAQILNLLTDLKRDLGLSYLFISHDLSMVRYFADRVLVMYLGRIVESAGHAKLWREPRHPYTRALLSAVPLPDPDRLRGPVALLGELTVADAGGCRFRARCPDAVNRCASEEPPLRAIAPGHFAACHLA